MWSWVPDKEPRGSELWLACDSRHESVSGSGDLLREVSRDIWSGEVGEFCRGRTKGGFLRGRKPTVSREE